MRILALLIGVIVISLSAFAFDDIGYAAYSNDIFSFDLPTGYTESLSKGGNEVSIYQFNWSDAYMRDFRAIVTVNGTSTTLPELVVANEILLGAKNQLESHKFSMGEKSLLSRNANEGYQGIYTIEEGPSEYFKYWVMYLAGDVSIIFSVGTHISKEEGGLDILKRMYRSFVLK